MLRSRYTPGNVYMSHVADELHMRAEPTLVRAQPYTHTYTRRNIRTDTDIYISRDDRVIKAREQSIRHFGCFLSFGAPADISIGEFRAAVSQASVVSEPYIPRGDSLL